MKQNKIAIIAWTSIFLLACVMFIMQIKMLANYFFWDTHWALSCAEKLLQGKKYYDDFFETNPPLIILFFVPLALLGKLSSISPILFVLPFFFVLIFLCLLLNLKLLKNIFFQENIIQNKKIIYFVLFSIALSELLFPLDAFTEKEHITVILFMPYLLLLTRRCQNIKCLGMPENSGEKHINLWLSAFVGFLIAFGVALKPYFLLSVIFMEMYYVIKSRSIKAVFRVEIYAMVFCLIFYMIGVYLYFPQFYSEILPLVAALYIPFFATEPFYHLLDGPAVFVLLTLFLALIYRVASMNNSKYKHYFWLLILATTGFLMSYFIAQQNWSYHLYPALALSTLLLMSIIFAHINFMATNTWLDWKNIKKISCIYLSTALLLFQLGWVINKNYYYAFHPTFSTILEEPIDYCNQLSKPQQVLVLSNFFHPNEIPLFCRQASSVSRFPVLALLPGISYLEKSNQLEAFEKYNKIFFALFNQDIDKQWPTLIIIDDRGYWLYIKHKRVEEEILPFLLSNEHFKQLFSHYQLVKKTEFFSFYAKK